MCALGALGIALSATGVSTQEGLFLCQVVMQSRICQLAFQACVHEGQEG